MALNDNEKKRAIELLAEWYDSAENLVSTDNYSSLDSSIGDDSASIVHCLGRTNHASRGAALTLCLSQVLHPELDIRIHKTELGDGFSARGVDENVTVPFLTDKGLPHSVQSHWMTRTLANDTPYYPDTVLKTVPKSAGPNLILVANIIHDLKDDSSKVAIIAEIILIELVQERNRGRIPITKPKGLSIDKVLLLLHKHFNHGYKKNAPRLPQLAMYAIYQCLMDGISRYSDFTLDPLRKMKSADRKSGTIGDIVISNNGRPIEALEIKFDIPIDQYIVSEAIEKVKAQPVERYLILSTVDPKAEDESLIQELKESFLKSNGCEIIVNGVYDTIKYYLRLLKSTNEFINYYTDLIDKDEDLNYEHKITWNSICSLL